MIFSTTVLACCGCSSIYENQEITALFRALRVTVGTEDDPKEVNISKMGFGHGSLYGADHFVVAEFGLGLSLELGSI